MSSKMCIFAMMKKTVTFIILLTLTALNMSCGDRVPRGVLDEETMVDFLVEAYQLEGFYAVESGYKYKSMKPQIVASYDSLFGKYGLTPESFDKTVEYSLKHAEQYEAIHQRVVDTLDARMNQ